MHSAVNGQLNGALSVSETSLGCDVVSFAPAPKPAPRTGLAPACLVVRGGRV
jgi:hypothetical protein